jgi:hypothetical protein
MSSYLKNLVARHLGRSNPVQPRLASIYEPLPNTTAVPHAQHEATRALDSESPVELHRTVERPERLRSVPTSIEVHPPADSSSDEAPMTVWRGEQRAPSPHLPTTKPRLMADESRTPISAEPGLPKLKTSPPTQTHPQATAPQLRAGAVAPQTPVLKDNVSPDLVRQYSSEPGQTVLLSNDRSESRPQSVAQTTQQETIVASPVDSTKRGIAVETRVAGPVDSTRRGVAVETSVAGPVESQRVTHSSSPLPRVASSSWLPHPIAALPEPTINVTIGRVEVRAMLPPPTPRKQASAPQLMGLDEYLRKRARGDDR